jgi:hypothetical protein
MTSWVFIIYLGSSQLFIPMNSYPTEAECQKALDEWTFEPGWSGTCLPGVIEPERRRQRR